VLADDAPEFGVDVRVVRDLSMAHGAGHLDVLSQDHRSQFLAELLVVVDEHLHLSAWNKPSHASSTKRPKRRTPPSVLP
jgi:hypothetical protein